MNRQYYAFDVVGEFTFQKKLGFLEKGGDVDDMMVRLIPIVDCCFSCIEAPELGAVLGHETIRLHSCSLKELSAPGSRPNQ